MSRIKERFRISLPVLLYRVQLIVRTTYIRSRQLHMKQNNSRRVLGIPHEEEKMNIFLLLAETIALLGPASSENGKKFSRIRGVDSGSENATLFRPQNHSIAASVLW